MASPPRSAAARPRAVLARRLPPRGVRPLRAQRAAQPLQGRAPAGGRRLGGAELPRGPPQLLHVPGVPGRERDAIRGALRDQDARRRAPGAGRRPRRRGRGPPPPASPRARATRGAGRAAPPGPRTGARPAAPARAPHRARLRAPRSRRAAPGSPRARGSGGGAARPPRRAPAARGAGALSPSPETGRRALRQAQGLVQHRAAEGQVGHQPVEALADVVQVGLGGLGDERGAPRRDLGQQVAGARQDPPQHQHRAEQLRSVGHRAAAPRGGQPQVVDPLAQPVHRRLEAVGQVAHHLEQQEPVAAREPREAVGIAGAQVLEVIRKAPVQRDHEALPHDDPALVEREGVTLQAGAGERQVGMARHQTPLHVARAALLVAHAGGDQASGHEGRQRHGGRQLQVDPQEPLAGGLGMRAGLQHGLGARSEVQPGGAGRGDDLDHRLHAGGQAPVEPSPRVEPGVDLGELLQRLLHERAGLGAVPVGLGDAPHRARSHRDRPGVGHAAAHLEALRGRAARLVHPSGAEVRVGQPGSEPAHQPHVAEAAQRRDRPLQVGDRHAWSPFRRARSPASPCCRRCSGSASAPGCGAVLHPLAVLPRAPLSQPRFHSL